MNHLLNDFDKTSAAWLRELVAAGEIDGDVDGRSITDITPADLAGREQVHFFAGIGGWPLALKMAGWPAGVVTWTGSCPCQPFSCAGEKKGFDDERDLWPVWIGLIEQCRPTVLFGEQVASPLAKAWLDRLFVQLEALGYAVGAANLCAAGVGAPHVRQRIFWGAALGDADGDWRKRFGQDEVHAVAASPWMGWNEWLRCEDGRERPTQPGIYPLVDGFPGLVGLLRGYGNAIVPQIAAEFVTAFAAALRV